MPFLESANLRAPEISHRPLDPLVPRLTLLIALANVANVAHFAVMSRVKSLGRGSAACLSARHFRCFLPQIPGSPTREIAHTFLVVPSGNQHLSNFSRWWPHPPPGQCWNTKLIGSPPVLWCGLALTSILLCRRQGRT